MNDVAELKRFAVVHARAQGIPDYAALLDRITTDDGDGPGSWAGEWTRAGRALEDRGELLGACRRYAMARFPYVDGPARQNALDRCVGVFDLWRSDLGHVQRLDVPHGGGRVRCWASGLSTTRRRPLLLITGGIVTVKEQWAPVLVQARRLGMAGIVTEMPGVGENTVGYDESSWQMFGSVLDAVADRALVHRTYAIALSFSGTMMLRHAVADRRIRGIVTAGAPVSTFFTDHDWQQALPRVTLDTLAHLLDAPAEVAVDKMRGHALTAEQLASLDIPVHCIVSRRDEIIPHGDIRHLRNNLRHLRTVENDDVHGSPNHVTESRLWTVASVLRMRGGRPAQRLVIEALLRAVRSRGRRP